MDDQKGTDVELLDRARLLVVKFIEAVPTNGILPRSDPLTKESTDVECCVCGRSLNYDESSENGPLYPACLLNFEIRK